MYLQRHIGIGIHVEGGKLALGKLTASHFGNHSRVVRAGVLRRHRHAHTLTSQLAREHRAQVGVSGNTAANAVFTRARLAQSAPFTEELPVFLPYILGRGAPYMDYAPNGAWLNLKASHTLADLCRAAVFGALCPLRQCADLLEDLAGKRPDLVLQALACRENAVKASAGALFRQKKLIPANSEASLLGGAVIATTALGVYPDMESAGKAMVNNMAAGYGTDIVGAAGISNNMSGLLTGIQTGFEDGGASLEGQLYGSRNFERTVKVYRHIQAAVSIIAVAGFFIMLALTDPIARLFSLSRGGYDPSFHSSICSIFHYELFGTLLLSFAYSGFTLLLGMGKTKTILAINVARIFVFRLPVIFFFQHFTSLDFTAVGLTMAISNSSVGIVALIAGEVIIRKERKRLSASRTHE